jgi:hypothetical protein
MFLDVAIYGPERYYNGGKAPIVEEVCEWLSMVYGQDIEVVKDKVSSLNMCDDAFIVYFPPFR